MLTIRALIEQIIDQTPGGALEHTVDTVKAGDIDRPVSGIVTTCMATVAVIRRAAELGANLIITHELTYYSHEDQTDWLADDPIYRSKRELIDSNETVIWRYHDHIHRLEPDGIMAGLWPVLGWQDYVSPENPCLAILPATTVIEVAVHLRERLGASYLRIVGDPEMRCRRVAVAVGASGGRHQIALLRDAAAELLVCGEVNEWEVAEYVRDANALGCRRALIVTGHVDSEEPGMAWLSGVLSERYPDLTVTHVPAGSPFIG